MKKFEAVALLGTSLLFGYGVVAVPAQADLNRCLGVTSESHLENRTSYPLVLAIAWSDSEQHFDEKNVFCGYPAEKLNAYSGTGDAPKATWDMPAYWLPPSNTTDVWYDISVGDNLAIGRVITHTDYDHPKENKCTVPSDKFDCKVDGLDFKLTQIK